MSKNNKGQPPNRKKPKAEKKQKWEEAEETPTKKTKVAPKRTQKRDDQGSGSGSEPEEPVESSSEEVQETCSKADLKKWKKDLKQGRITKEEFDKLRGIEEQKAAPTEEDKKAALAALSKESALQEYKQKKNELDNKSRDVKIESITLSYKGQPLLVDTDLVINNGRKYGLIGPNGSGTIILSSKLFTNSSQEKVPC